MLTVTSPAASTALTTLETVKSALSVSTNTEDEFIERQIIGVTTRIVGEIIRVMAASDGTRTIGQETLSQQFRLKSRQESLVVGRWVPQMPVTILGITEDDTALETTDYEFDAGQGILSRLGEDKPICWSASKIVVSLTAGWLLPADGGRNLPQNIEDAAIELIKLTRFNRTRDTTLRSENILDGLYSYQLFAPSDAPGGIPENVAALLAPFCLPVLIDVPATSSLGDAGAEFGAAVWSCCRD